MFVLFSSCDQSIMLLSTPTRKRKLTTDKNESISFPRRDDSPTNSDLQSQIKSEDCDDGNVKVEHFETDIEESPPKRQRLDSGDDDNDDDFQRVANIAFATVMSGRIYKCLMISCGFQTFNGATFGQHVIKHDDCNEIGCDNSFCGACNSFIEAYSLVDEFRHLTLVHTEVAVSPAEEEALAGENISDNDRSIVNETTTESPENCQVFATSEMASNGVFYKFVISQNQNEEPPLEDAEPNCSESDASEDDNETDSSNNDRSLQSDEEEGEKFFKKYWSALALFFFYFWIVIELVRTKLKPEINNHSEYGFRVKLEKIETAEAATNSSFL